MKHNHNQSPHRVRNRITAAALVALTLAGGGAALEKYNHDAAQRNAAIDRQLETVISPELGKLGAQALAAYNAQPDKTGGKMTLSVRGGVAVLNGDVREALVVGGKEYGSTTYKERVVMPAPGGVPDPNATNYVWFQMGTTGDSIVKASSVQFTAPGTGQYRQGTLPGDRGDGWSAAYANSSDFKGLSLSQTSTDDRTSWVGNQNPVPPMEAAATVIRQADELVTEVLAGLSDAPAGV